MPLKVAQIRPQGLNKDKRPDGQTWSVIRNAPDRDGAPSVPEQDQELFTSSPGLSFQEPIYGFYAREPGTVITATQNDSWFMVGEIAGVAQVIVSRGGAAKNISPLTYGTVRGPNNYTHAVLNGQIVLNDGFSGPDTWDWDFATPMFMAPLPGWFGVGDTCQSMRAYRDFLIAMDTRIAGTRINDGFSWSDRAPPGALPTTWTAAATNEAGSATLGDTRGRIVDGLQLGDSFMMYKTEGAYRMTEIGLPEVMAVRRASVTEGVMARNCVQTINNTHYVVGNQDIYQTDGVRSKSIINRAMRSWFFGRNSQTADRNEVYTAYNPVHNEFWVCFKGTDFSTDYANTAMIFDGDRWSVRDIGRPTTSESAALEGYPHMFTGLYPSSGAAFDAVDERLIGVNPDTLDDRQYLMEVENGLGQGAPTFKLEIEGIELAPPGERAVVKRVRPICNQPQLLRNLSPLGITLGSSETGGLEETTWGSKVDWDPTADGKAITYPLRTRYLSIRCENDSLGQTGAGMQIYGFDVEYEAGGNL